MVEGVNVLSHRRIIEILLFAEAVWIVAAATSPSYISMNAFRHGLDGWSAFTAGEGMCNP
ncbi:MAG TPA: hypothetical protein VNP98_07045 [Chthoniobacterales bacterium]|nr:hypothetical protein [Chthoniobacterales bacterium]